MKVLIFPEYKKNKFIDGYMIYVINDNYKYNISFEVETSIHDEKLSRNNNFCMENA